VPAYETFVALYQGAVSILAAITRDIVDNSLQSPIIARFIVCLRLFNIALALALHAANIQCLSHQYGWRGKNRFTSLIALFEYNSMSTTHIPRYPGLSGVMLPASLLPFSKYPSSYPPDVQWRDWQLYRKYPILLGEWLTIGKWNNGETREIVQIHRM
jgi:hypothetical protein